MQQSTASAVNYVKSAIMPSSTDDATRDPEVKVSTLHLHTQPSSTEQGCPPRPVMILPVPVHPVLSGSKTCNAAADQKPLHLHLLQGKATRHTTASFGGQLDSLHGAGVHSGSRGDD